MVLQISEVSPSTPSRTPESTAPSSPPDENYEDQNAFNAEFATKEEIALYEEEVRIRAENEKKEKAAENKNAITKKRKRKGEETNIQRAKATASLDELLAKSTAFSRRLIEKTQVLGRVGSSLDGETLGEHNLTMAKQPKCMVGGIMRDYQLEGLTWMLEICVQGMSGILADEMGLGKTIQTISLIAHLREVEGFIGPHLIIAPLSTLSNWVEEFQKWVPGIPVLLYHGTAAHRKGLLHEQMLKNRHTNGRITWKFPIVCTSPEMILADHSDLTKINWEFIIIDEGHRMKNSESKLFQVLRQFHSHTRLLLTGTPLQNNLKELWSLLNFLLPQIFGSWEQFESWFDFSDLQNEAGTQEFIESQKQKDLVSKLHIILQPLLLRRLKADVAHLLPKKREYILYAPMTKEQTELYNAIADKAVDSRKFLEDRVVERLSKLSTKSTKASEASLKLSNEKDEEGNSSDDDIPLALRTKHQVAFNNSVSPKNAFEAMMKKKQPSSKSNTKVAAKVKTIPKTNAKIDMKKTATGKATSKSTSMAKGSLKRKPSDSLSTPAAVKSSKTSRDSTPTSSRGRKIAKKVYAEAYSSEDDGLSDDEFEEKLAQEFAEKEQAEVVLVKPETERIIELARQEISAKKLGNPIMQLRLTCNSPHNFYAPWSAGLPVDESLVTSSGKMLLLDRLLKSLFERGSKVLVFSQFKTQLDLLEDYARELRQWNVCRIDGSVAQDDRRQQIKEFNENPEYKLFLLSTRAGGQGINLASADTVILFDSDWNPQQDLQAQDRAHRIGQTRPVVVFRLATKNTVEEQLLAAAEAKRRLEKAVIQKGNLMKSGNMGSSDIQIELNQLLVKDGHVFRSSGKGGKEVLSDEDLDMLCDRSDEAYARAANGLGDADRFKIIETKAGGFTDMMNNKNDGSEMVVGVSEASGEAAGEVSDEIVED